VAKANRDHQVDLVCVAELLHEHLSGSLVAAAFEDLRDGERERVWTLRQMVAADVGITLMPELAISGRGAGLRYLPFRGSAPHRRVGLCWRQSSTRGALLEHMAEVLSKAVAPALAG